ncbi:MAG: hypothetical protein JXN62_02340 [Bacteroidales bacterium]|nr:hypothetical protein [Bacteroidales bacterium]
MLETLDAEKFYSGLSEALNRNEIRGHINEMKELGNKVICSVSIKIGKYQFEIEDSSQLAASFFNIITMQMNRMLKTAREGL